MSALVVSYRARVEATSFIDAIWSGAEWLSNWAATKDFTVDYDDGEHQAARLLIDWQGQSVELSVTLFRESATRIAFFCPTPPAGLVRQTGVWEARADGDGGCITTAMREVSLARFDDESDAAFVSRVASFRATLAERLRNILASFASSLEDARS